MKGFDTKRDNIQIQSNVLRERQHYFALNAILSCFVKLVLCGIRGRTHAEIMGMGARPEYPEIPTKSNIIFEIQ